MFQTVVQLVLLVTSGCILCAVSCPQLQEAYKESCYEFVGHRLSFSSAQAWCEESGGHLAFVLDEDTQYFLQRHLDPEEDTWLGVAPSAPINLQYPATADDSLSWLDGSPVIYSNWASSPQPGDACGHVLKNSGFQWKATGDCGTKLPFICQFESRRSTVCVGSNITLQCGSAQVLIIDGGFYGRKNIHYCQSTLSSPAASIHLHCGWVDVEESLTAHCRGRRVCRVAEAVNSFVEPCPHLGSYLSVDYHCEDALTLTVSTVSAVFTDVSIGIEWLLQGKPTCRLSTGDGHVIHLYSPEGWESTVVHKYTYPGRFAVAVECDSNDVQVTAQKKITIVQPITDINVSACYAEAQFFPQSECKTLYGGALQIQIEAKAGSDVSYVIHGEEGVLSSFSVDRANVPRNITVTPQMVKQLGPGCHQLTLYASNMVTVPGVSTDLQVCIVEKVAGLKASVMTERDDCLDPPDITVGVSLEHGAPVLLLFSLTGDNNDSFCVTREMNGRMGIFHLGHPIHGNVRVKVKASNGFSSLEADVDMLTSSARKTATKQNGDGNYLLSSEEGEKHIRVARSLKIKAQPSDSVANKYQNIELSMQRAPIVDSIRYEWACSNPCKCAGTFQETIHIITKQCLPGPFVYNKYHFNVINKNNNKLIKTESICIILAPMPNKPDWLSLTCVQGCEPVTVNKDAKIKMECSGDITCPQVAWNIEDPNDDKNWPQALDETKSCYKEAEKRPLIARQDGGTEYTVSYSNLALAKSKGQDVTVVVTSGDDVPLFTTYIIKTSSSSPSSPSPSPSPSPTEQPAPVSVTAETSSQATPNNFFNLSCSISPSNGTDLDAFNITCKTEIPCSNCQYCFKTGGKHLRCSNSSEVLFVFLPLGDRHVDYNLTITATAKNDSFESSTHITAQVLDSRETSGSSVGGLMSSVKNAVAQLEAGGLLSGETLRQIFSSVSNILNGQSDDSNKGERQKLRELMLGILRDAVNKVPMNTAEEVQVIARGLTAVIARGTELSYHAQEESSLLLVMLSSSLLHMDVNISEEKEIYSAASSIVEGANNILSFSPTKNISDALLVVLKNTQSVLLMKKDANEGPTIIQHDNIGVFVNRVTLETLHKESISFPNCSCPKFSLPKLPSNLFPSDQPFDIRTLHLAQNPFSWSERGNVSGQIGALSLTTKDGSAIDVENLSEDVEILLPRPAGETFNITVLDLGNYSTTVINIPSDDSTLVLKMVPSEDPLPFKLLLGYMSYPTETNHIAVTEMPQQGATPEERYTWLLDPANLKGKTGVYYLVVRPVVGPGIKSINSSLTISAISAACKFWDESILGWSDRGCRVGVETTQSVTQCLCNHLTFFGSSFFVTPNLVDPSRSAELFGTFTENPVVVCFVGALFVAYLLVVVWARRKDIQDSVKARVTVLEDNNPVDEYSYLLSVSTGHRRGAATSSQVTLTLLGADANSEPHHLTDPKKSVFERGAVDTFLLTTPFSLGELQGIRLWHNNSGSHPAWYVGHVVVQDIQTEQKWHFLCNSWLAIDLGDCSLDKVFPVSTETDLTSFSNLFVMKTTRDLNDGHLWYSVISRPPSSTFTCVQRVSCCFSLLLCTMLTSLMFYGIPTDPSEQIMDLGNVSFHYISIGCHFEFTWQQFMIGVQSSLIMFPVNILIVSIFRNTRPREMSCCKRRSGDVDERKKTLQTSSSQAVSTTKNVNVTFDVIIKDIARVSSSLSKTVRSNISDTQSASGQRQELDIHAVLNEVEDFIKSNYNTESKTQSFQKSEVSAGVHPGTEVEVVHKSNRVQYLYRQLCHMDKELSLLGSSSFPTPHIYSQALQQVQAMKGFLEDQLLTASCVNLHKLTQEKLNPADSTDAADDEKKGRCCHGGLPWWFVFVGWLLVAATSVVSAYFTMLYGLKFGKERSISWLISMTVSFFQSILVIQPLKVLGLAAFFALVIKRVDDDDFQNVAFANDTNAGNCDQRRVQLEGSLYEPPPPADVERMKRMKMMEQRAFALLREITFYMVFLWMLLLVAYGQRDPNAFYLNQHIRGSFTGDTMDSMSLGDVFTWANTSLLSNLFGPYPGFITDGNSKLVGNARLRQLRVEKSSCQVAASMLQLVTDCHAPYSWEFEDMGSYDPGWGRSLTDNASVRAPSPWVYQTQTQLRSYPVWGKMLLYRGGGFVAELGPDVDNASRTLEYLFRNKWLDVYTKALFVEFTIYNANVNLFCIVTLLFETTAVGAFQLRSELHSVRLYQSTGHLHIFVMAAEIIYLLFIIYYMFLQGKLMRQQRRAYFRSKWNLLELTIILLSWSAVAVFIKRTLVGNRDLNYYQNHKDQFASFYETATTDSVLQYMIAFLVLLATVKLWHLLRLNPKMHMITATLQRAWKDISSYLLVIVIMFLAYSMACNLLYGWKLSSYRTLPDALLTIVSLQIGIFNYDEVFDHAPLLSGLLIGSCIVFLTFVVLNLLVSVILVAFNQEQIEHKHSEEKEIVDLMLQKVCGFFGLRYGGTTDSQRRDPNGSSDSSLNNSREILGSSVAKNHLQTCSNSLDR